MRGMFSDAIKIGQDSKYVKSMGAKKTGWGVEILYIFTILYYLVHSLEGS